METPGFMEVDARCALFRWHEFEKRLDDKKPDWRKHLHELGGIRAVERRQAGGEWKDSRIFEEPGLGIPLAAEFLKNAGFDPCKPDRHINRAIGSFGVVKFKSWKNSRFTSPNARVAEVLEVMRVVRLLAVQIGRQTVDADNAIWILCAKSGVHLQNEELAELKRHAERDPGLH